MPQLPFHKNRSIYKISLPIFACRLYLFFGRRVLLQHLVSVRDAPNSIGAAKGHLSGESSYDRASVVRFSTSGEAKRAERTSCNTPPREALAQRKIALHLHVTHRGAHDRPLTFLAPRGERAHKLGDGDWDTNWRQVTRSLLERAVSNWAVKTLSSRARSCDKISEVRRGTGEERTSAYTGLSPETDFPFVPRRPNSDSCSPSTISPAGLSRNGAISADGTEGLVTASFWDAGTNADRDVSIILWGGGGGTPLDEIKQATVHGILFAECVEATRR